jgi:DNA polymerase-1
LVFDAHKSELDIVIPLVENCMKTAIETKVPIEVETGTGLNWLEAH